MLTLGRQVREARADGTPLASIVEALNTRRTSELSKRQLRAMRSIEPEKALRHAEQTANAVDGLTTLPRSTSKAKATGNALRAHREHSEQHRALHGYRRDTPEAWESAAALLDLLITARHLMAAATGKAWDPTGVERNAARHRAEAERLRQLGE